MYKAKSINKRKKQKLGKNNNKMMRMTKRNNGTRNKGIRQILETRKENGFITGVAFDIITQQYT